MGKNRLKAGSGGERTITLLAVGLLLFMVWSWLSTLYPPYIMPSPGEVARRAKEILGQVGFCSSFPYHLVEAVLGFASHRGLPLSCF